MELTKEYFDQVIKGLVTKEDAKHLAAKEDLNPLATKVDVREAVEELARITNAGFDDIQKRLDVTERVQKIETTLERKFGKLEEALHIKL
jgi:hypothetical protein